MIITWKKHNFTHPYTKKLTFSVSFGNPVVHWIGETVHYRLDHTEESDVQWRKLLPNGGHLIHIQESKDAELQTFTVTLFHQLDCLDILRREYLQLYQGAYTGNSEQRFTDDYLARKDTGGLVQHCFHYLRQSILCNIDSGLESTEDADGLVTRGYDTICRDWTKLYEEAERNFEDYRDSMPEPHTV
ncbi:uncharacterized protein C8R40DRAFT_1137553 [Lentinula edodes]|uniref:uncharacterized protein n=1 Tax=Lentinula edodes TaxID=5353 RepID=UPI001BF7CA69|nr:uncharacterized protein C8R40DRAFT_1137553 [Lentinula edodes]KAF8832896.1 hypothetical protein HHX47_DHR1001717 [Lentinula edodes]KAH7867712.1 hypothetical protein C8R40DRAFT_1137553 [Lentinula edodes]